MTIFSQEKQFQSDFGLFMSLSSATVAKIKKKKKIKYIPVSPIRSISIEHIKAF